ncbi:glycosyltransferase [Cupriavidus sp. YAF13]|uniref:glycosyltransferase n=1 Tax=Cupriavidus sp. YAF13 TaxID=3233075 RepID=UPI003F937EB7
MNIIVVYNYFPHYRKGVFEEFSRRYPNVKFVSSSRDVLEGIPRLDVGDLGSAIELRTLEFGRLTYQVGLCRLLWSEKCDAVVFLANPNFISTWIAAFLARIKGNRVIFWGHGFLKNGWGLKNLVRAAFFRLANASYVYGYGAKRNAISLGFDPSRIHVGFNSLDYDNQIVIRNKLIESLLPSPTEEGLRVLCVSRLTKLCRYDLLVEAAAIYGERGYGKVRLEFIGDGPVQAELMAQASRLGVQASFEGAIYDESIVAEKIFRADVVASPGKVGLTAIHSLMYGTPVITHGLPELQMPEFEAIVDEVTGLLYFEQSAEALCECLRKLRGVFKDRDITRQDCFRVVDEIYNPKAQVKIMERAIIGAPASEGNDVGEIKWSNL